MTAAVLAGREASWRERAATLSVFLALGIEVGTWAAAIPALRDELQLDPARLSLVLLTISVASVCASIGVGVLAPRLGNGRLAGVAAVLTLIGFAAPGLARNFGELLLCGALLGGAAGAIEVALNGHASDIERRWGRSIMSSFHAAFSAGGLMGAALGGLTAAAGAGVQGRLWTPLVLAAALVAVGWPALGVGARGGAGHGLALARPSRAMLTLGVASMLCYLLEGALADWSALYLTSVAGASAGTAAAGYGAFSITMAVGRLSGDAVVNRLGPRRVLVLGGLIGAAGFGLAVAVPVPLVGAVGFALVGVGAANIVPVIFSAAGRAGPSSAAGIAIVSTFGFAGFLGGPPLIGALATVAGLRTAIGSLVVVALLIACAGLQLKRR